MRIYYQLIAKSGGGIIKLSLQSKKKEVETFLDTLKLILNDADFDPDDDLILIRSGKSKDREKFSTPYTLVDLEYDSSDVADCLKKLTTREYSETLVDKDDVNPPLLFVFGMDLDHKQIYIKLKIKENQKRRILCVSFHYAEEKMSFPYQ